MRFRKSVKISKGVKVNFSKSGASLSLGRRGNKVNLGSKGVKHTVGIPGTGLSYSTKIGAKSSTDKSRTAARKNAPVNRRAADIPTDVGYSFEEGCQQEQAEQQQTQQEAYTQPYNNEQQSTYVPPRKRRTWLWVLGWIFIFPVPLTILIVRNKKLNTFIKIGIIAVAWILYLLIGLSGSTIKKDMTNNSAFHVESVSKAEESRVSDPIVLF